MLRPFREQSGTSRTNPSEPEAKPLSSQPPPKAPEPPQATTAALATNYTISDDRSNSSRHAHNLLLALQDQSRDTLFASFEPQTVTSAGLSSGKYTSDQGPSFINWHREERTISNSGFFGQSFSETSSLSDSGEFPGTSASIPKVRSVCDVTNVNLADHVVGDSPDNHPEF
jgi:hypothetical protein